MISNLLLLYTVVIVKITTVAKISFNSALSMSCKQKINTKSLLEAELVGVDDTMTFVMWMKHFFESQVKQINEYSKLKPLGSDTIIE